MRTLHGLLLSLVTLVLASQFASGATIDYSLAFIQGFPTCGGDLTGFPVVTVSVASCNGEGSYTASELGWTASVSGDAGSPGNMSGNVSGSAGLAPAAVILGGSGSGFFQVEYTDLIHLLPLTLDGSASMSAGDLSVDTYCTSSNDYCATSLTDKFWSAWIPFVFGEAVELPTMSTSFAFGFLEGGGDFTASESVSTFDIVDANMNPISGAYASDASQTPEPSIFYLSGFGLAVIGGIRRYRTS